MEYKAYLKQSGDGCDYTIGCARTVLHMECSSLEDAIEEMKIEIANRYTDEQELESCDIYEVSNMARLNVAEIYSSYREEEGLLMKAAEEKSELEQYKRLKAKYDNS